MLALFLSTSCASTLYQSTVTKCNSHLLHLKATVMTTNELMHTFISVSVPCYQSLHECDKHTIRMPVQSMRVCSTLSRSVWLQHPAWRLAPLDYALPCQPGRVNHDFTAAHYVTETSHFCLTLPGNIHIVNQHLRSSPANLTAT